MSELQYETIRLSEGVSRGEGEEGHGGKGEGEVEDGKERQTREPVKKLGVREVKQRRKVWSEMIQKVETDGIELKEVWSKFGGIYCINLKEREDRYLKAKALFDSLDMPVKFHRVDRHPNGGQQGCYESHIEIISEAYLDGLENVLIFEDDVEVGKGLTARKMFEVATLAKVPNVNVVYLGWHPRVFDTTTKHVMGSMHAVKANGTHAYVITRSLMAELLDRPYDGVAIDVLLARYPSTFGVYPTAFVQASGDSDISKDFSSSKWMKPVRSGLESWAVNVNIPPQAIVFALVVAIVSIILLHIFLKLKTANLVILFMLIFVVTLVLLVRTMRDGK
jgi:hypothetical protein